MEHMEKQIAVVTAALNIIMSPRKAIASWDEDDFVEGLIEERLIKKMEEKS